MRQDLTRKLLKRFPVLYQDYYSPMTHTCMCWGFECSTGWFDIIWQLSLAIEEELGYSWLQKKWFLFKKRLSRKWNKFIYKLSPPQVPGTICPTSKNGRLKLGLKRLVWWPYTGMAVTQVKEKFGTLRYYCGGSERVFSFINLAEVLSAHTCEECGDSGKLRNDGGWYRTECESCRAIRLKRRREGK